MMQIRFGETIRSTRVASRLGGVAVATVLGSLALCSLAFNAMAGPSVYPTGVTRYDPAKAYGSYVLFSAADKITRLIDLNGNVVHEWTYPGFPSVFLDPQL